MSSECRGREVRSGKLGETVRGGIGFGIQQSGAEQCSARVGLSLTGKTVESGVGAASEWQQSEERFGAPSGHAIWVPWDTRERFQFSFLLT